jgi:hypothetical protein
LSGIKGVEDLEWTETVRTQISKTGKEKTLQGLLIANVLEECAAHYHSSSTAWC